MFIGDVRVIVENGPLSAQEAAHYIRQIQRRSRKRRLVRVTFVVTPDHLDLKYVLEGIPFERICRIGSDDRIRLAS